MKRMLAVSLALWLAMYGAGGVTALAESTPTDLETPPITEAPSESPIPEETALPATPEPTETPPTTEAPSESPIPEETALPATPEPTETPSSTPVVLQDLTAAGGQVAWRIDDSEGRTVVSGDGSVNEGLVAGQSYRLALRVTAASLADGVYAYTLPDRFRALAMIDEPIVRDGVACGAFLVMDGMLYLYLTRDETLPFDGEVTVPFEAGGDWTDFFFGDVEIPVRPPVAPVEATLAKEAYDPAGLASGEAAIGWHVTVAGDAAHPLAGASLSDTLLTDDAAPQYFSTADQARGVLIEAEGHAWRALPAYDEHGWTLTFPAECGCGGAEHQPLRLTDGVVCHLYYTSTIDRKALPGDGSEPYLFRNRVTLSGGASLTADAEAERTVKPAASASLTQTAEPADPPRWTLTAHLPAWDGGDPVCYQLRQRMRFVLDDGSGVPVAPEALLEAVRASAVALIDGHPLPRLGAASSGFAWDVSADGDGIRFDLYAFCPLHNGWCAHWTNPNNSTVVFRCEVSPALLRDAPAGAGQIASEARLYANGGMAAQADALLTLPPCPTAVPTLFPTEKPTFPAEHAPTEHPTSTPSTVPTEKPTVIPTDMPTASPTAEPTFPPTEEPAATLSPVPTAEPTAVPTASPTTEPDSPYSPTPSDESSPIPTCSPTSKPVSSPVPSVSPTASPAPFDASVTISGRVEWVDDDDFLRLRPSAVTIQLLRGNTVVAERQATAKHGWTYRFDGLPGGVTYTVGERILTRYYPVVRGTRITNVFVAWPVPGFAPALFRPDGNLLGDTLFRFPKAPPRFLAPRFIRGLRFDPASGVIRLNLRLDGRAAAASLYRYDESVTFDRAWLPGSQIVEGQAVQGRPHWGVVFLDEQGIPLGRFDY